MAERYGDDWTVVGADLRNEPLEASWGGGGADDWPRAAERAAQAVHEIAPDWLIFVQGIYRYNGSATWWGGNFQGFRDRPIRIARMSKLVLSPHLYGPYRFDQSWFNDPDYPDNLPGRWHDDWSFLQFDRNLPLAIGEFDFAMPDAKDRQWRDKLFRVMDGDVDADGDRDMPEDHPGMSWFLWPLKHSDPARGVLEDDWTSPREDKVAFLRPHLFTSEAAAIVVRLTLATNSPPQQLTLETVDGSAVAGEDYWAVSQTVDLEPGDTRVISIPVVPDAIPETSESLHVRIRLATPPPGTSTEATFEIPIEDDD